MIVLRVDFAGLSHRVSRVARISSPLLAYAPKTLEACPVGACVIACSIAWVGAEGGQSVGRGISVGTLRDVRESAERRP